MSILPLLIFHDIYTERRVNESASSEKKKTSGRAPLIAYRLYAGKCLPTARLLHASMARPKVHPANRIRASTACTACRASKKRCSGYFPCTNCVRKGRGHLCTPFKALSATGLRSRPIPSFQPEGEAQASSGLGVSLQRPLRSPSHSTRSPDRELGSLETGSHSPEATHRTHPRLLRNLQGERGMKYLNYKLMTKLTQLVVYVGKAASLSFLQLLRETVTQHIGPSQFSHNVRSEDMLESEAHHDSLNFSEERCTVEEKDRFIQHYYVAVGEMPAMKLSTT